VNKKNNFDIIVIGGGLSGMSAAIALAKSGLNIALIEKKKLDSIQVGRDIRALSISPGSVDILSRMGVWEYLEPLAGRINHIRVLDNYSPFFLDFENNKRSGESIGYIIEAFILQRRLIDLIKENKRIQLFDECEVIACETIGSSIVQVKLSSGQIICANMGVVADGKYSKTRDLLGIKSYDYDYKQTAIVAVVSHQKPHMNTAIEHFMPTGPFAILPLKDNNKAGIVWTEKNEIAKEYLSMNGCDFEFFLNKKFTDYLGKVKLEEKPLSYPLTLKFSTKYHQDRFVLLGDAAHAIHPLAGQGFNLGIRDIDLLDNLVSRNFSLGLDIADPILLSQYQRMRLLDNSLMMVTTHTLDTLFSNDYTLLKPIRKVGLSIVNKMQKVKTYLMMQTMEKL